MQPQSKFSLPYITNKEERKLDTFDIDTDKAVCKIVPGQYNDGTRVFGYAIEVVAAPLDDYDQENGGDVTFIGCINSTPSIEGGEGYFEGSPGTYKWTDKKGIPRSASSVRGILSNCGFTNSWYNMTSKSKQRVPCVFYINLLCPVLDWLGSAGKTHIDLQSFAGDIAKAVSSVAYKMPTFHGQVDYIDDYYDKPKNKTAKDYLIDFLKDRRKAIEENPSLINTDRITQSTVWYRMRPIMIEDGFTPRKTWGITRETIQNEINETCKELWPDEGISREDLGIIASARATMYYNGMSYPVSIDNLKDLAENGVVVIVIEKEGIADVLTSFADMYGIALVHTKGHFVEYCKDLIEAVEESGGNVATLTDYDAVGIEIAKGARIDIPRIGVDRDTVRYFQEHGFPDLTEEQVEERYTPKISTDIQYLKTKRIELDSIVAAVGNEALWNYIMYRLKELFPEDVDYNRVISSSPGSLSDYYPEVIQKFNSYIEEHVQSLLTEEQQKIESELENVKGFINVADKREEINKRLGKIVENNHHLKEIAARLDEIFKDKEGYDDGSGTVAKRRVGSNQ